MEQADQRDEHSEHNDGYNPYLPESAQKHNRGGGWKRAVLIILIIVACAGAAGGGYWYFVKNKKSPATSTKPSKPAEPQLSPEQAAQPQTFKSTKLNVELTHLKDWKVSEDSEEGLVTLSSPSVTYTSESGKSKNGTFVLKFQLGTNDAINQTLNASVAVLPSELIGYTAPTEAQRHYTNISYGGQENDCKFFIVTGATQFSGNKEIIGNSLVLDNSSLFIVGGYTTQAKPEDLEFDAVPKTGFTGSPAYTQAIEIVKSLKIF